MANTDKFREALTDIAVDDVSVDENGRVVISNSSVLDKLKEMGASAIPGKRAAEDTNVGCCTNGIACKGAAMDEIADMRSRLVSTKLNPK